MAILKVARMGHPILREIAREVPGEEIATLAVQEIIDSHIKGGRVVERLVLPPEQFD